MRTVYIFVIVIVRGLERFEVGGIARGKITRDCERINVEFVKCRVRMENQRKRKSLKLILGD